jgi:tRNA-2-methylthio-N6-dimethylallyladenosine synthase
MNYLSETYGCQMNKAESAALELALHERGWFAVAVPEQADLVLINTCSVRITAENRAWGRINHYAALKRQQPFTLVVTGCMAERLKAEMMTRQPAIDYVLGNFQKPSFGLILDAVAGHRQPASLADLPKASVPDLPKASIPDLPKASVPDLPKASAFAFAPAHWEIGSFRSFLPIMHGCNNFCSYCIVPYVRGREVSRDPQAVLAEFNLLATKGVKEVTLLGQNVNSYQWQEDGGLDFPGLLQLLASKAKDSGIGRIRFISSHPKDLSDRTIATIAADRVFARHIHLCVQHGSNRILTAMNRRYTAEMYLELVDRLKRAIPDLSLSTDILMGFPGETEDDVEATLDLMRQARFAYAFMYFYNPREGTPAATMPEQLPESLKKARLARIIALQKELTNGFMRSFIGRELEVLVEAVSSRSAHELLARTDHDMMVVFPGNTDMVGRFTRVRLTSLRGTTFKAEEVH